MGDLKFFEAAPPLIRLILVKGSVALSLRTNRRLTATEKGAASDPIRFLFVLLWACRESKQTRINLTELKEVWLRLRTVPQLNPALTISLPNQMDLLADKIRDWAKKINKDNDIRQLQRAIAESLPGADAAAERQRKPLSVRDPFVSVSSRSRVGAQVEVSFPKMRLDELDWDEGLAKLV